MTKIVIFLFGALLSLNCFAHGDHRELTKDDAIMAGKMQIQNLVVEKKIPATWSSAEVNSASATVTTIAGKQRWVVTYQEPNAKGNAKTLDVILTPAGQFVDYKVK